LSIEEATLAVAGRFDAQPKEFFSDGLKRLEKRSHSCVALLRTDVSEEPGASFIRVTRIGELGTTQAATSN
jgi:hypothetical protein